MGLWWSTSQRKRLISTSNSGSWTNHRLPPIHPFSRNQYITQRDKCCVIAWIIAAAAAAVLSITSSLVLFTSLPSPIPTNREIFPDERLHTRWCPSYGCPIYPPEWSKDRPLDPALTGERKLKDNQERGGVRGEEEEEENPGSVQAAEDFHRLAAGQFRTTIVTHRGPSHDVNQDRAVILRPFLTKQNLESHHQHHRATAATGNTYGSAREEEKEDWTRESFLLVLLDGHGVEGHNLAQYVLHELPQLLANKLNHKSCCQPDEWIQQQLIDVFVQVNAEAPPSIARRGGCTASVTLRIGPKLFFANAGDSRTILVAIPNATDSNSASIVYETRRDKPHLDEERRRIEGMGGKIHIPPHNPALARVVVYSEAAGESIGLAMSRSLGDWEWKQVGVTAEPLVDVVDLSRYYFSVNSSFASSSSLLVPPSPPMETFVLAASDGLWDLRKKEFFAKRFADSIIQRKSLLQTVVETIETIEPQMGYRDDITVIVAPTTIQGEGHG